MKRKKLVIIGGGFGGLNACKALKNSELEINLLDRSNYHLFQPLLYQVATAVLSPGDIAAPIRGILSKQKNVRVLMSPATSVDQKNRKVLTADGDFEYDYLIIAVGSRHSYFGNDGWEQYAPGLKTISDALSIRERILSSFEKAEKLNDPKEIEKFMTFVIVGGGPTGVEMAGAIAEISKKTLLKDFRNINPALTKIILVEGSPKLLNMYDEPLNKKAKESLESLGVTVRLGESVTKINSLGLQIGGEFIETPNLIWAAGNKASTLIESLDVQKDRIGRAIVERDCSIKSDSNVFVIGDSAMFSENGKPLAGIAPVAVQQGKYVAGIIENDTPKDKRKPFVYFDKGSMATIGRARAVMQMRNIKLSGSLAWFLWGIVHIMFLISFRNKYKVMSEWIWYYLTQRQGIRLITHKTDWS